MSETQPAVQLEGQIFLFQKPAILARDAHSDLGLKRPDRPYRFCETVRAVPLTISEVAIAQRHYPVIFSSTEHPLPMAVVGLIDDVNLFVNDDGLWKEDAYIPGYIRRYPFALANDQGSERMALIVDLDYDGVANEPDLPFFDGEKPSESTSKAMEYCQTYERDRLLTIEFGKRLAEYDVITNQIGRFTPEDGEGKPFAKYFGIEEQQLNDLSDEKYLEMRKSNILPLLHASLMSMGNWRTLLDMRARRFNLDAEQVLKPLPRS